MPHGTKATIVCQTELGATVYVEVRGGWGGMPTYAGGFIKGFTGHENSLLSARDMRSMAAALVSAADQIEAAGLKSFEEVSGRKSVHDE